MQAIKLIAKSLPTAVHEPGNRQGREDMSLASLLARMASPPPELQPFMPSNIPSAKHRTHRTGSVMLF